MPIDSVDTNRGKISSLEDNNILVTGERRFNRFEGGVAFFAGTKNSYGLFHADVQNPGDLLSSKRFQDWLNELKKHTNENEDKIIFTLTQPRHKVLSSYIKGLTAELEMVCKSLKINNIEVKHTVTPGPGPVSIDNDSMSVTLNGFQNKTLKSTFNNISNADNSLHDSLFLTELDNLDNARLRLRSMDLREIAKDTSYATVDDRIDAVKNLAKSRAASRKKDAFLMHDSSSRGGNVVLAGAADGVAMSMDAGDCCN